MGRREQRERERKRAASTCQTLDRFLPAAKRVSAKEDPEASSHRDGAASDVEWLVLKNASDSKSEHFSIQANGEPAHSDRFSLRCCSPPLFVISEITKEVSGNAGFQLKSTRPPPLIWVFGQL